MIFVFSFVPFIGVVWVILFVGLFLFYCCCFGFGFGYGHDMLVISDYYKV